MGGTTAAPALRSRRTADAPPRAGVLVHAATRYAAICDGDDRISQVPAQTLAAPHMLLRPRTDRTELAWTRRPTRPRVGERPWLCRWTFEAQSHGWTTRCLRFTAAGCPDAVQDSLLTCAATLWWAGLSPAGSAMEGFRFVFSSHHVLLPRACLAQPPFLRRSRIRKILEAGRSGWTGATVP
jgi:hypothetical protein